MMKIKHCWINAMILCHKFYMFFVNSLNNFESNWLRIKNAYIISR